MDKKETAEFEGLLRNLKNPPVKRMFELLYIDHSGHELLFTPRGIREKHKDHFKPKKSK